MVVTQAQNRLFRFVLPALRIVPVFWKNEEASHGMIRAHKQTHVMQC
jgi:hypothetical protein